MDKTEDCVICNNHKCENWKHENDYIAWGDNKLELDKTNCSIHTGSELLDGDCKEFRDIKSL